jgi:hypothetical protein
MANIKKFSIQPYPRDEDGRADSKLFPRLHEPFEDSKIIKAIDLSFSFCLKNKKGDEKKLFDSPEKLVNMCIKHLKERSDPILSSYFIGQLKAEQIFELDAVSHEMQRHRMSIGLFYQLLLLELLKLRWPSVGAYDESDLVAEIDTPGFDKGLRLYMSIKKSADTVGGQDIPGAMAKLEALPKNDKQLNRPYLCVFGIATPSRGRVLSYFDDRKIKKNKYGQPYSVNCEHWGPGFLYPFITGREPIEIYRLAYSRVADYLPFRTLEHREKCSELLGKKLSELGLVEQDGTINPDKFLCFVARNSNGKST